MSNSESSGCDRSSISPCELALETLVLPASNMNAAPSAFGGIGYHLLGDGREDTWFDIEELKDEGFVDL